MWIQNWRGDDFFRSDRSTQEEAILTIEQFHNQKGRNRVFSYKDFRNEAENILIDYSVEINKKTTHVIHF